MKNILIVEDNEDLRRFYELYFAKYDTGLFHVDIVENSQQALAKVKMINYDWYLIDYYLPGDTGLDLINKIYGVTKKESNYIIITSRDYFDMKKEIDRRHFVNVLVVQKPFFVDEIKNVLFDKITPENNETMH